MTEPRITPILTRILKTAAMSSVVKMGDIDDSSETLPVVVFLSA